MRGTMLITRLFFICMFTKNAFGAEPGKPGVVKFGCGNSHFWIQVSSPQTPQFVAIDMNGVHSISSELAARCGYTISPLAPGLTSLRASFYSCFTQNKRDEEFVFQFKVLFTDRRNSSTSPLSAVCPSPGWTHREIVCEENYMEVNLNSGDWRGHKDHHKEEDSSSYQLMFLRSHLQVAFMSLTEAQRSGFTLGSTPQRTVFRALYQRPQAEVEEVDGVSVEVLRVFLVYRQKLVMMMMDMSVSCAVNGGEFDGSQLLWDIPRLLPALLQDGTRWQDGGVSMGLENEMLDEAQMGSRGLSLIQDGGWIRIKIPFGADGGYRRSLVENNTYKEQYSVVLMYQDIFSLLYDDGQSFSTRHKTFHVLDSPLVCRLTFTLNNTLWQQHVFTVVLRNVPADVQLQSVTVNGKTPVSVEDFHLQPLPLLNGSQSYQLQIPFDHESVHWMYVGGGVVEYTITLNFTLTVVALNQSYYHVTSITAQALDTFPPEITAQCSDAGISFSVIPATHASSVWEVGVQHRPLTAELVERRGYRLQQYHNRTTLEVPLFSVGFTYDGINLSSFYGTFQLLLRDSKSLEVQTSTTKRCLFRTQDLIVCSADGTVTLVATLTWVWPLVSAHRTRLLDPSCGPKQTNRDRVLFEFKLDSCGTRATVGEWFVTYENEILFERQLISDGPNVISRESEFRMTARCFYPLTSVLRLFLDQSFTSDGYGFLSKDAGTPLPGEDCSNKDLGIDPRGLLQYKPSHPQMLFSPSVNPPETLMQQFPQLQNPRQPLPLSSELTPDWSLDFQVHYSSDFEDPTSPSGSAGSVVQTWDKRKEGSVVVLRELVPAGTLKGVDLVETLHNPHNKDTHTANHSSPLRNRNLQSTTGQPLKPFEPVQEKSVHTKQVKETSSSLSSLISLHGRHSNHEIGEDRMKRSSNS